MRRRREKGFIIILIIIVLCLFLIVVSGGLTTRKDSYEDKVQNMDNDIAVTDYLGIAQDDTMESEQDFMDELTFLVNNFAFERSGSQILIEAVAFLLLLYLVLIGPVTHLYLKKHRKKERMWFTMSALSLAFGCIILLMSNDFIIREPYADVIQVITPGQMAVCYGVSTSPGEDSYSLYFDDCVKSLQPWAIAKRYVIDEKKRSLTLYPESAFTKDYFQYSISQIQNNEFIHNLQIGLQGGGEGRIYNTTGYTFTQVMLCYEDSYCILPAMNPGDECVVTVDMWKQEEYGVEDNLKEELQMQTGLSADEEVILNLAWYKHVNDAGGQLHIGAVSKETNIGLKDTSVDLISYSLFYQ